MRPANFGLLAFFLILSTSISFFQKRGYFSRGKCGYFAHGCPSVRVESKGNFICIIEPYLEYSLFLIYFAVQSTFKTLFFNKRYLLLTIMLFIIEVLIGFFMHDRYIRPYGGDFLVVILIYCFVKSFLNLPVKTAAISVLLFAYAVEVSQYFKLVVHLGLKNSKWANILLGNSFSWADMLMYTCGILLVVAVEKAISSNIKKPLPTAA